MGRNRISEKSLEGYCSDGLRGHKLLGGGAHRISRTLSGREGATWGCWGERRLKVELPAKVLEQELGRKVGQHQYMSEGGGRGGEK